MSGTWNRKLHKSIISHCELCPRRCGVDRLEDKLGYCGAGSSVEIFRYAPHYGEEPPISGQNGSGTVFFSRCTLKCVYCQNFPWSQEGKGESCSILKLTEIFRSLAEKGCHNWNLVSPTPWLPMIREALEVLKHDGVSIPVVYNTSGFERDRILAENQGLADIYLVDLRYSRDESAQEGSGVAGYVGIARKAVEEMWRQTGPLRLDSDGIAVCGVICRLLILPGRTREVMDNLQWLAETFGPDMAVSVMSQYTPAYKASKMPGWNRTVNREEYEEIRVAVEEIGLNQGWMQDFGGYTSRDLIGFEMSSMVQSE